MSFPNINISIQDACGSCGSSRLIPPTAGGCGCSQPVIYQSNAPNDPCGNGGIGVCDEPLFTDCMFYSAEPIPQFAVNKNDPLTGIIIKLFAEIAALKNRVTTLGG